MPLDPSDVSTELGGLAPFGAHFADHGEDGHPGWDIGFRVGGIVRAAAEGVVQSVTPIGGSSQSTVQIFHRIGDRTYRTVYVGVESVRPSVTPDAPVRAGDPLGLAGVITAMVGSSMVTYAQIHFQVDDFASSAGLTNRNAVCPEPFLSPKGRAVFEPLWRVSSYSAELLEPYACNPRDITWPLVRVWDRQTGDLPVAIEFTRRSSRATELEYRWLGSNREPSESGTARTVSWTALQTIDLVSSGRPPAYGIYEVRDSALRLQTAGASAQRPGAFSGESQYLTGR
jgi:hypothetical protein